MHQREAAANDSPFDVEVQLVQLVDIVRKRKVEMYIYNQGPEKYRHRAYGNKNNFWYFDIHTCDKFTYICATLSILFVNVVL